MSSKLLSVLKKTSQRNKDLIFGYCRKHENKYNHSVYPQIVHYLCLLYTMFLKDDLEPNLGTDKLVINVIQNELICKCDDLLQSAQIIEGINEAKDGIHAWIFEIIKKV